MSSVEKELEKKILAEINSDKLFTHVEFFSTLDRISGGPGEAQAIEYVRNTLEEYGVPVELHEFESLLSYPKAAELEILIPAIYKKKIEECITHAFSASGEVTSELIYVGSGQEEDYKTIDVKGKIVLCDGLTAGLERMAEDHGAIAAIHVRGEYINEDIVTIIWGTPTPSRIHLLPCIPIVSVNKEDGAYLRELTKIQQVSVRLKATIDTAWRKTKIPVATIKGTAEPYFLLVGGHIDSWYEGVTDNATGNASCLELARVLMKYQTYLKRGVKIAWWPGHSTGRYSGSAWYADNFWLDLQEYCFGYTNIDSPGVKGGTERQPSAMPEALQFAEGVVEEIGGARGESRWGECKMGDQSFLNIGITSISFYTAIPIQQDVNGSEVYGSGGAWWWHTKYDTLDKADKEVLALDTKVYAAIASRLCTRVVLPFDFVRVADAYVEAFTILQDKVGSLFDLTPALELAEDLKEQALKLNTVIESMSAKSNESVTFERINTCLIQLSRILNPILHTESGKYDQDPAVMFRPIPVLQQVVELNIFDPNNSEFRFLKTHLIRQRNRVVHTLNKALNKIKNTLNALPEFSRSD